MSTFSCFEAVCNYYAALNTVLLLVIALSVLFIAKQLVIIYVYCSVYSWH